MRLFVRTRLPEPRLRAAMRRAAAGALASRDGETRDRIGRLPRTSMLEAMARRGVGGSGTNEANAKAKIDEN